jgi:hypothetical protein
MKIKNFTDDNDEDYEIRNMKKNVFSKTSYFINDLDEFLDLEQKDVEKKIELDNKMEFMLDKAKKKLGINATNKQIESFIDLNKDNEDIFENDELNDLLVSGQKGEEVLDQGASYGELNEFDFEDGDGFNYTEEEY